MLRLRNIERSGFWSRLTRGQQFVDLLDHRKGIGDVEDVGHPQAGSRFTARRSLMKRQPTTCGSSPWQQVESPLRCLGVDPVWPTWFMWVMKEMTS